jgi:hypothetical protein
LFGGHAYRDEVGDVRFLLFVHNYCHPRSVWSALYSKPEYAQVYVRMTQNSVFDDDDDSDDDGGGCGVVACSAAAPAPPRTPDCIPTQEST